jgi:hypothetical protein
MPEINTFKDWWRANSDELFQRVKKTDNWWDEFEKCWEVAQDLELKRCANLAAQAATNGELRKFLDAQDALDKILRKHEVTDE